MTEGANATFTVMLSAAQGTATITIDNQAYDLDTLSPEAKGQLTSLQFVDAELARLQAQAGVIRVRFQLIHGRAGGGVVLR